MQTENTRKKSRNHYSQLLHPSLKKKKPTPQHWNKSNQETESLYNENLKTLKKLKRAPEDGKTFHAHGW